MGVEVSPGGARRDVDLHERAAWGSRCRRVARGETREERARESGGPDKLAKCRSHKLAKCRLHHTLRGDRELAPG